MSTMEIVSPGLLTTVQDLGRTGYQRYGIPVCGALDSVSLRIANILVGNRDHSGRIGDHSNRANYQVYRRRNDSDCRC